MELDSFINADKSIIIAPAGYGKTYTIAECIAAYDKEKQVLVLTHTHAGIDSLRKKISSKGVASKKYHLETICSFALNLTKSYHINKDELPSEADTEGLFSFAVRTAARICQAGPIQQMLKAKYDHLIVDEYQDCSPDQHTLMMAISNSIKTHLLGDPLQGIFDFRGGIIDFADTSMLPFMDNSQELDTPWRWINAEAEALGNDLALIRSKLLSGEDVNLEDYKSIIYVPSASDDYLKPSNCSRRLYQELTNEAIVIHPLSSGTAPRKKFIQHYPMVRMLESIDDKDYYYWCMEYDKLDGDSLIKAIVDMLRSIGSSTPLNSWFGPSGNLKAKRDEEGKRIRGALYRKIQALAEKKTYSGIVSLIAAIERLPGMKIYRKDFLRDICHALYDAEKYGLSATESIEMCRNAIRQTGRSIQGKFIGTTLLTKGLEFDTVIVLNAQLFSDPRQLYVAFTRCCRRLVVIADGPILHPYAK